jgi:tmRNA-binding protein
LVRERGQKAVATNRQARHDYHILDVFDVGIVLTGTEGRKLGNYSSRLQGFHQKLRLVQVVDSHLVSAVEREYFF